MQKLMNMNLILQLLLGAEVVSVATLSFAAVGCTGMEASIALAADHLVAVVLHSQDPEGGLNST